MLQHRRIGRDSRGLDFLKVIHVNWILYSFSEVFLPLPPFKDSYIVGIVENSQGIRQMTQIDKKYRDILRIGLLGDMEQITTKNGELCFFIPSYESSI